MLASLMAGPSAAIAGQSDGVAPTDSDDRFYCQERKLGTWFYCSMPKPKDRPDAPAVAPTPTAAERMERITTELRELKARAILEPSQENITAYVRFQRAQLDRSSMFADMWQRAVWQDPSLDYTLQRPVNTLGKREWLDDRKVDRDRALVRLSQRYGLFYFFAQSCGACEIFSPILKSVADSHNLSVMAVSTDGGPSPVFRNYVVDSGQRERMGLTDKVTPAVVLFDTKTRRVIPVGYGVMAADELMDRIFTLTETQPGRDF
ncbi:conjugal transfer protein TraF [Sphingomonas sp. BIUV-7]|uniref:Conjugal transfer protein TraF n=2 Tax=Sphingomonas natans TaxID=3063330 RepID=A0ABT8Y7V1_9SPHN|nr:conjugal transfer protein TraF [Sphingomonas sp. BIUV-7]MDO6414401.1 conjugal transfer protein TraF [Sphingomonas sp. BIUV-7]